MFSHKEKHLIVLRCSAPTEVYIQKYSSPVDVYSQSIPNTKYWPKPGQILQLALYIWSLLLGTCWFMVVSIIPMILVLWWYTPKWYWFMMVYIHIILILWWHTCRWYWFYDGIQLYHTCFMMTYMQMILVLLW